MVRSLLLLVALAVALQGAGACSSESDMIHKRGEIGPMILRHEEKGGGDSY